MKNILPCIVCMCLFASNLSAAAVVSSDPSKDNKPSTALTPYVPPIHRTLADVDFSNPAEDHVLAIRLVDYRHLISDKRGKDHPVLSSLFLRPADPLIRPKFDLPTVTTTKRIEELVL